MAGREGRRRLGPQSSRSAALEELKSLRENGKRRIDGLQIKEEERIYDTLAEEEYALLVAKRRLESKNFVVDDDGLGYGDIGEEDNWDVSARSYSSEEEGEPKKNEKQQKNPDSRKKDVLGKKERELRAAAALMGKQNVSGMFAAASGSARTVKSGNVDADSVLDDVLCSVGAASLGQDKKRNRRFGGASKASGSVESYRTSFTFDTLGTAAEEAKNETELLILSRKQSTEVIKADETEGQETQLEVLAEPVDLQPAPSHENAEQEPQKSCDVEPETTSSRQDEQHKLEPEPCPVVPPEPKVALNAKISMPSSVQQQASAAWQAIRTGGNQGAVQSKISEEPAACGDAMPLPLDENQKLPFFFIDAHEEAFGANAGTIFLFGKVRQGEQFLSCCVIVRNIQRCIYVIPSPSVFPDTTVSSLEGECEGDSARLKERLQELARDLKMELVEKLMESDVTSFSMVPVKRSYAFGNLNVSTGPNYYMKLSYPFKDPPLPNNVSGKHFSAVVGTHTSALELLLVKKKIKGPCWILLSNPVQCAMTSQVSWCKLELALSSPKDLMVAPPGTSPSEVPRLVVASLSLRTVINHKQNVSEIVSASLVFCHQLKVDAPMAQSEWNNNEMLGHFSIIRKLDAGVYPVGFTSEVTRLNSNAGSNVLVCEGSERALLNRLMIKLYQLDPDVLVGHNISAFDIDVLMHRLQACKVPSTMWSRIGRLKRSQMPRLTGGGGSFGGGASLGAMTCVAGRLLCDTYLSSRELLKEVSYSLTQLSKSQLGRERKEISPSDVPGMYDSSVSLLELVESAETDAWLSLSLMFHLSVLPLTRQLTNISGNLWSKTLQGARAQRVEYLLLHEFHSRKFILPDKQKSEKDKDHTKSKRKANVEHDGVEGGAEQAEKVESRKKGPAYSGGLVLEPKKGLYDKYILLLDFNSLYPSIIQEYNICFTTVESPMDGSIPSLPSADTPGVLPQVLRSLVERRKQVKQWLKRTTDVMKFQQLDIQQQALKLTANSMYGCLGFPNSRFYAKSIAELITSQGREILQSTVDHVQNVLNLEVIYGDTDSIMINSGLDDLTVARSVAVKVIKEINKKYKLLEIDLDGIFKRMLLLKKKKYASVKVVTNADGSCREVIEQKGLDIVRRDWSMLSKEIGNFILEQILSGGSREDVVDSIHNQLRKLQDDMRNGLVELEKYIITKSLTKAPEDYPDGRNQPHVQVALRRKQQGHRCFAGDTVAYIICYEEGSSALPIAERARHPEELQKDRGNWMIDIDYYLSQQIHPVVSRLCAPIEGTDPIRIADCLGLDSSRFQQRVISSSNDKEEALLSTSILDDEDRYKRCDHLELVCPNCLNKYAFAGVSSLLRESEANVAPDDLVTCPNCSQKQPQDITSVLLSNSVTQQAVEFIERFYDFWMVCDDEMCNHTTRDTILRVAGAEVERGAVCPNFPRCNGRLVRQYTQVDLYNQLSFFCRLLDVNRALEKVPEGARAAAERKVLPLRSMLELAQQRAEEIRDRCTFRWVQMSQICI